jgi:hypothetical protein
MTDERPIQRRFAAQGVGFNQRSRTTGQVKMKSIIATAILTVAFLATPGLMPRHATKQMHAANDGNITIVSKTSAFPVKVSG